MWDGRGKCGGKHDMNLVDAHRAGKAHRVECRKADLRVGGAREAAVKEELGQCREAVPHRLSVSLCPPCARTPSVVQDEFVGFFRSWLFDRSFFLRCGFLVDLCQ